MYLILRLDNLASRCHPHPRDLHPSHLGGSSSHVTRTRGPRQGDSIPPPGYYHLVTIVPSEDTKGPTSCPPPSSHPPVCGQRRTSTPLTTHNNWRRQVNSKCSIKSRGSFISASQILQGRCHLALNVIWKNIYVIAKNIKKFVDFCAGTTIFNCTRLVGFAVDWWHLSDVQQLPSPGAALVSWCAFWVPSVPCCNCLVSQLSSSDSHRAWQQIRLEDSPVEPSSPPPPPSPAWSGRGTWRRWHCCHRKSNEESCGAGRVPP